MAPVKVWRRMMKNWSKMVARTAARATAIAAPRTAKTSQILPRVASSWRLAVLVAIVANWSIPLRSRPRRGEWSSVCSPRCRACATSTRAERDWQIRLSQRMRPPVLCEAAAWPEQKCNSQIHLIHIAHGEKKSRQRASRRMKRSEVPLIWAQC